MQLLPGHGRAHEQPAAVQEHQQPGRAYRLQHALAQRLPLLPGRGDAGGVALGQVHQRLDGLIRDRQERFLVLVGGVLEGSADGVPVAVVQQPLPQPPQGPAPQAPAHVVPRQQRQRVLPGQDHRRRGGGLIRRDERGRRVEAVHEAIGERRQRRGFPPPAAEAQRPLHAATMALRWGHTR